MAQAPHPAGEGANFVRHIVSDPKNVPDVMLLYGYLGASSEEGHERLYLSPDLSNFVEVPRTAILHRAEAAREQDPHGGVTLWVKKDAKLSYKMAPAQAAAQQALAYYFAGAIQAGAGAATPPIPAQTLPQALCPPQTIIEAACPVTLAAQCPTRIATCHVTCAPNCTHVAPCPTHVATCVATCHFTCAPACTHLAPCPTFVATCPPHATCVPNCTHVAPCPTHVATCVATCQATCAPACPTHHLTCAPVCTHIQQCVTRGQPDCPFPSEIPAQCTHLPNCPHPQAAMGGAGAGIRVSVFVACSIACPTRYVSCYGTCNPECFITRYATCATCAPECFRTYYAVTCNPIICEYTRACPVETAGCPFPGPGPIE